ncbi:hypothetical protein K8R42_02870 [bacterium]|nr:hypothetical protein [bacterium]
MPEPVTKVQNSEELKMEIERLKEQRSHFTEEADNYAVLDENIKELTEKLNKSQ